MNDHYLVINFSMNRILIFYVGHWKCPYRRSGSRFWAGLGRERRGGGTQRRRKDRSEPVRERGEEEEEEGGRLHCHCSKRR
jgi:hypothetical protein